MKPTRIQRMRTSGWRMPDGAIYVGRPSPWGNPFPVSGSRQPWMAVAFGQHGDPPGRRASAVIGYRWWISDGSPATFPVAREQGTEGSAFEYSNGRIVPVATLVAGLALRMFLAEPLLLPPVPDLEPLRGHDLVCWCRLDEPCHADVLLELLA